LPPARGLYTMVSFITQRRRENVHTALQADDARPTPSVIGYSDWSRDSDVSRCPWRHQMRWGCCCWAKRTPWYMSPLISMLTTIEFSYSSRPPLPIYHTHSHTGNWRQRRNLQLLKFHKFYDILEKIEAVF